MEFWLAKKDGEIETKFDRQFTIPPCPVTATYRPIPEWKMNGAMVCLSEWKEINLLGGESILVAKLNDKTDSLRQPYAIKTLIPLFGLDKCITFTDRLYQCFNLHLKKEEDHHATEMDELIKKITVEAEIMKKKLESAQSYDELKSKLDLSEATASVSNGLLVDARSEIDRLNAKIAELEGGQGCQKELTELTSKFEALHSQVNYLQRCNLNTANRNPRNDDHHQRQHDESALQQHANDQGPPERRVNRGYNPPGQTHVFPYDANQWRGRGRGRGNVRGRGRSDRGHFTRGWQYW